MTMKKKHVPTDEEIQIEIDKRIREHREEYIANHTPVISMKYGNTYISISRYDEYSSGIIDRIATLLKLMDVDYAMSVIIYDKEFFF